MSDETMKTTSGDATGAKAPVDWSDFDALTEEDIERGIAKDPTAARPLTREWFETAELVRGGQKHAVTIRLDAEVVDYFRAAGPGYQSRINAVLKNYVRVQQPDSVSRGHAHEPAHSPHVAERPAAFMKKDVHTVKTPEGKWVNKVGGKVASAHRTQETAADKGRQIAKRNESEHVIHGRDGRVREKNSYGRDPNPPKDKR